MKNYSVPLIAAHRGSCAGNIPCNSESAFKAALNQGADIIELDVSVSIDRKLFVFHPGKEFAYLRNPMFLGLVPSYQILKKRLLNMDKTKTQERILTLDDALELLKNKCIVNIDKFWTAPDKITDCIKRHNMQEQIIIKTSMKKRYIDACSEIAPDLPFMPIISKRENFDELLNSKRLNLVGAEILFTDDNDEIVSDEFIDFLHKNNLKAWGNAIVYNYKNILSGGHTDDTAITADMDYGWGWFVEKGFDIVQTDWVFQMKKYFESLHEQI